MASTATEAPGTIRHDAKIWLWRGPELKGSWHFVTISGDAAAELKMRSIETPRGFRSVRVTAQIGETRWQTSVFPQGDSYILPIKRAVRVTEDLAAGDDVVMSLSF